MSLQIQNLTKIYGTQKAVANISFEATKGNIVGFLGPNGAGKSTTMKIATCYVPPTSGTVKVCGYDVMEFPLEVRQKIGYLPEHNPLYLDMYVQEYLEFMGGLYDLRGQLLKNRVAEMIELCGLGVEQHKKIVTLSKGYRQRVGLAQSLIHNPEVLILDEPTTGLDPNQILEIRKVIKEISKDKTVIFSTHIMQEVKALCNEVIIIKLGEIVANHTMNELQNLQNEVKIFVEFAENIDIEIFRTLPQIKTIKTINSRQFELTTQNNSKVHENNENQNNENFTDIRAEIFRKTVENQWTLLEIRKEETTLEKVFYELTK
jgi:ABC-2 type transport system ATP-binding protein